jgi:hypothetical protein
MKMLFENEPPSQKTLAGKWYGEGPAPAKPEEPKRAYRPLDWAEKKWMGTGRPKTDKNGRTWYLFTTIDGSGAVAYAAQPTKDGAGFNLFSVPYKPEERK